MKPFDDSVSEENTPAYQDLTILLRQARPIASVTAEEQSQMLARVRARLHQTEDVSSEGASSTSENSKGVLQSFPLRRKVPHRRLSRMRYTLNMIAAVLVVAVIAGASLWLFSSQRTDDLVMHIPTGALVGSIKAPVTVRSEAGGLEASLQVTSGPYFLSELLATTFTLTNHSNKRFFLPGSIDGSNPCEGTGLFHLAITGGSDPHYDFPISNTLVSCPPNETITTVDVGKTLTTHGYILLTNSGQVALTSDAIFLIPTNANHVTNGAQHHFSINGMTQGPGPLDGHWPIMQINVATKIPMDRTLSLRQQNSAVIINAPISAAQYLVYYYVVTCVGTMGTSAQWYPVTTPILHEPECSGANKHWTYAVGAPGYAIASIELSS
jgi:hypothetical protein